MDTGWLYFRCIYFVMEVNSLHKNNIKQFILVLCSLTLIVVV